MSAPPLRQATVVVIGGGLSGINMAIKLKAANVDFVVLEACSAPGGTWHANKYPGCACDIPFLQYTYSFAVETGEAVFAPSDDILTYLHRVCDRFGVRDAIRCNCRVESARWDPDVGKWRLQVREGHVANAGIKDTDDTGNSHGEVHEWQANATVCAVGQLSVPYVPRFPGLDSVSAPTMHTARWDRTTELAGKRILVVGNGASAVQTVEATHRGARELVVLQRSPKWLMRRLFERFPRTLVTLFRLCPALLWLVRLTFFVLVEFLHVILAGKSCLARGWRRRLEAEIESDMPRARELEMLPAYRPGCSRVIVHSRYVKALTEKNVRVVKGDIQRFKARSVLVRQQPGDAETEIEFDVLVLATGFRMANLVPAIEFVGSGGRTLADAWSEYPRAYLGLCTEGFPNLFFLYGPNTNTILGSITFFTECAVGYIVQAVLAMRQHEQQLRDTRTGAGQAAGVKPTVSLEVRREVLDAFVRRLETWMVGRPELDSCSAWYKNEQFRVVQNWPGTMSSYWWYTRTFRPAEFRFVTH